MAFMLKHSSIYARLKNSYVQDLYWSISNKRFLENRRKQIKFYRELLRGFQIGDLIFDIGANVGEKTDVFIRLGARVIAVEPDERNQEILYGKFIRYRVSPKPVSILGKAVSERVSFETMWVDGPGSALNTLSKKWVDTLKADGKRFDHKFDKLEFDQQKRVETTTLESLTSDYGFPFFVKIDVEGHELSVLKGLQRPVPYLSFEINLPEFRQEGCECLSVLTKLAPDGEFNFASDVSSGLVLEHWADSRKVADIVTNCKERCIEVFWRNRSLLTRN